MLTMVTVKLPPGHFLSLSLSLLFLIAVKPIACILLYAIYFFAPYLPQQNGVGEWRNQTAVDTARALLKQRGMLAKFWGEVVVTVVHPLN